MIRYIFLLVMALGVTSCACPFRSKPEGTTESTTQTGQYRLEAVENENPAVSRSERFRLEGSVGNNVSTSERFRLERIGN